MGHLGNASTFPPGALPGSTPAHKPKLEEARRAYSEAERLQDDPQGQTQPYPGHCLPDMLGLVLHKWPHTIFSLDHHLSSYVPSAKSLGDLHPIACAPEGV